MIVHIKHILEDLISRRRQLGRVYLESKMSDVWLGAAGPEAAQNAEPANIKGGTLTIEVSNSSWIQELSLRKKALMDAMNRAISGPGEHIKDIHFRIGTLKGGTDGKKETQ